MGLFAELLFGILGLLGFMTSILVPLFSLALPLNEALLAVCSISLTLLAIVMHNQRIDVREMKAAISSNLRGNIIRTEDEFFNRLEADILNASYRADLTYFDNFPPNRSRTKRGQDYHLRFYGIVREMPNVHFRRIVRLNSFMLPWIGEMIQELKDQRNFSLALYPDPDPSSSVLDLITVQLIDESITYLVSVGSQEPSRTPRDLMVVSPEFNEMWSRYFNNLWNRSEKLLERGTLLEGWEKIENLKNG